MIEVISQLNRKAKKEHICDWCGCKIDKGEEYEHLTLKFDYIYSWKNHLHCKKLFHELEMYNYDTEGVTGDEFMENVQDFLYRNLTEEENDEIDTNEKAIETALRLLEGKEKVQE